MRLAIFVDTIFYRSGDALSTNEAYVVSVASLVDRFAEVTLIGRLSPRAGSGAFRLDRPGIQFLAIPYYERVFDLWRVGPQIYRRLRQAIGERDADWDYVLICGPNPVGQLVVARACLARGIPIGLVVRQNLIQQMRYAYRGWKRAPILLVTCLLEWKFRRLARGRTVFAVGSEVADTYSKSARRVVDYFPSLVRQNQQAAADAPAPPRDPARLLVVGRLSPEKGHAHLFTALSLLRREGLVLRLDVAGSGPLEAELRRSAVALEVATQITFLGFVPYGAALERVYREAGVLVLPSLPGEGFPQVLIEALATGLPVVATGVGGVPSLLRDGLHAIIAPMADPVALAGAIRAIVSDPGLARRLGDAGRILIAGHTLEASRDTLAEAITQDLRNA